METQSSSASSTMTLLNHHHQQQQQQHLHLEGSHQHQSLTEEIVHELHEICAKHNYSAEHLFSALSQLDPNLSLVGCELQQLRRHLAKYSCPPPLVKNLIQYRRRLMSRSYFMRSSQRREDMASLREKEYQAVLDEINQVADHIAELDLQIDHIQDEKKLYEKYFKLSNKQSLSLTNLHLKTNNQQALIVSGKVYMPKMESSSSVAASTIIATSSSSSTFLTPNKIAGNFPSRCHDEARNVHNNHNKKRLSATRSTNRSMVIST